MRNKYIMYLRKSQMDRDFEDISIEETLQRHRRTLTEYATSKKLNVDIILEEVVSGESLSQRPQMLKCLELINTGEYEGIICMDIDRLSRGNSMDSGYIMQVLQLNKCKIITPQKTYDLDNENDEQFTDMKFMFSRYELKVITKRLVAGRTVSASEGRYLGSVAPFGYEIYKLHGEKGNSLRIIPEEAELVRMIFDMYVNQHKGYNTIAAELNSLGLTTKTKKKWSQTSVVHVVTNPVYIGKIRWKYSVQHKTLEDGKLTKQRKIADEYKLYDGLHEPIISEELFYQAESIRTQKSIPSVALGRTLRTPFAELLFCDNCGSIISRKEPSTKQRERRHTRPWYRCKNKCGCRIIPCYKLENAIVEEMRKWLNEYSVTLEPPKHTNSIQVALGLIQNQITNLQEQQNKICSLLETGVYSIELFTKRNATITAELAELKKKHAELKKETKDHMSQEEFIPKAQQLLETYDTLTPLQKNKVWKSLLEKVTYYRAPNAGRDDFTVHIYPKIPSK